MRPGTARFMMRRSSRGYRTDFIAVLISFALSSSLWSQAGSSVNQPSASGSPTKAEKTSKDAEASATSAGPHDDSFINWGR